MCLSLYLSMFRWLSSDAAVVDYIFNSCDPGKTGQVLASTLVQFCHNHFDSENHKYVKCWKLFLD